MSFGYRKSRKITKGLRLNVSKRGLGLSGGTRHARVSTNTRGQKRGSFSLFGMFWRKRF